MPFRLDVQGLRALAVLAVMLFHQQSSFLPAGFLGVDVFFVLSGYLITGILLHQPKLDAAAILHFYHKRLLRIVPAYAVLLIISTAIFSVVLIERDVLFFQESLRSALWFNSHHHFAQFSDYFAPSAFELPLLHTWSLGVEMQFYLLYPFVLMMISNRKWLLWVLVFAYVALSAITTWHMHLLGKNVVYYALYARIPEFLAGGVCALLSLRRQHNAHPRWWAFAPYLGFSLLMGTMLYWDESSPLPGLLSSIPIIGIGLLLLSPTQGRIGRYLSTPILVWIGTLSYSLYLWHWFFLVLFRYYNATAELTFWQSCAYWGLSFACAAISYHWIECRFRAHKPSTHRRLALAILIATSILMLPLSTIIHRTSVPPLSEQYTEYGDLSTMCHGQQLDTCEQGATHSPYPSILVIGDSHAGMLNQFFDHIGQTLNLTFDIFSADSCIPIEGFDTISRLSGEALTACQAQIAAVQERLPHHQNIIVVGHWQYQFAQPKFLSVMRNWLAQQHHARIWIMTDVEKITHCHLLRRYRWQALGVIREPQACPFHQRDTDAPNELLHEMIRDHTHTSMLTIPRLDAPHDAAGRPYYLDNNHLNGYGALNYAKGAVAVFEREVLTELSNNPHTTSDSGLCGGR